MKNDNPFLLKGYKSKELFCDREKELKRLCENIENSIDTTLVSPRRMGKTGLILHLFEHYKKNKSIECLYVDINFATSQADFIKLLSESILKKFPEKTTIGKLFMKLLKGFRPIIRFDAISGEPQIEISYKTETEKTHTLQGILQFLNAQKPLIVLAIDEFQQINDFPETNTEAMLRSTIQHLHNIRFVFCGSKKTMMTDMFANAKRPFYASTQFMYLDKINAKKYTSFIEKLFRKNDKGIDIEVIEFILDWTRTHTFYTQSLCNMVFSMTEKDTTVDIKTVKNACLELLERNEPTFFQYKELLSISQWKYLTAVAKENSLEQPSAKSFLMKYNIGSPTDSQRLKQSLLDKDLLLETITKEQRSYQVADVFFSRWLESNL
ncbi:MAG: ATP-binding protein [Bacteroidales bacterium]|nr:ATP-binding protein [Bacteroidales bacterium]